MRVHWTDNAISQLIGIYDYIARDSSFYAQRMVDRLTRRTQQISDFPRSGRMVPEYEMPDIREVNDERIVFGATFRRVDPRYCRRVERVRSQAVNRFRREGDKPSAAQQFGGPSDDSRIGKLGVHLYERHARTT